MTSNQIRYLITVAHEKSLNRAAKKLFISQSALSNAIMSVEQEFGKRIFNRNNRGVTLTSFGSQFIAYITPINRQLNLLYSMSDPFSGDSTAKLTVISNGFYFLSDAAAAAAEQFQDSGIRLSMLEDYSGNFTEQLVNGSADIGIVRIWSCYKENTLEQYSAMNLMYHPICRLTVGVDIGKKNPLYDSFQGKSIPSGMLEAYPLILHESLDSGPYTDILYKLKLPKSQTRFIVNSRAAVYELLGMTDGYTLNSRKASEEDGGSVVGDPRWRFIPLRNSSIHSEIGWIAPKRSVLSQEARLFLDLVKENL